MGTISKFGGSGEAEAPAEDADKGNLFNRFIKMISAIFSPLIWALAATGLLKAFVAAAAQFGWLDTETSTYVVMIIRSPQKRESGVKPERSGHCNGGANLIVHCTYV